MPRNTADPLVEQLIRWGIAHANRYAYSRGDRTVHALQAVRDHAPGTTENALRDLIGRDGGERRRFMAARAEVKGLTILPTWAVDPVPARNDAGRPHDNPEIAVDMGIPDELRWVERALASMARQYQLRALIVRTEFTVSASQAAKAAMVREKYGGSLSIWQYRRELQRALDWLSGMERAAA